MLLNRSLSYPRSRFVEINHSRGEWGGASPTPEDKDDDFAILTSATRRRIGVVVAYVLELAQVASNSLLNIKDMEVAAFSAVILDRPIALHHLLIAVLALAGVMERSVSMDAVIDVAVYCPPLLVHEEKDVRRSGRGTDSALFPAAIPFVEPFPPD